MKSYLLDFLKEKIYSTGDFNCSDEDFTKFCALGFSGLSSKSKQILEMRSQKQSRTTIAKCVKLTVYQVEKKEKEAIQFIKYSIRNSIKNKNNYILEKNTLNEQKEFISEILAMIPSIIEELLKENSYHPAVIIKMNEKPEELADHFRFHFGKLNRERFINISPEGFKERVSKSLQYLRFCQKRIITSYTATQENKEFAEMQLSLCQAEEDVTLKIYERITQ